MLMGDIHTAHREIDLARPRQNLEEGLLVLPTALFTGAITPLEACRDHLRFVKSHFALPRPLAA